MVSPVTEMVRGEKKRHKCSACKTVDCSKARSMMGDQKEERDKEVFGSELQ